MTSTTMCFRTSAVPLAATIAGGALAGPPQYPAAPCTPAQYGQTCSVLHQVLPPVEVIYPCTGDGWTPHMQCDGMGCFPISA